LKADFELAAQKNHVYPLSADFFERVAPQYRPKGLQPAQEYVFFPSDIRYAPTAFPELNATWKAVAKVKINGAADSGPILVQGGKFAGYALALENGAPVFTYDPSGRAQERRILRGQDALTPGDHEIAVSFVPDGAGAQVSLSVDGTVVSTVKTPRVIRILAGEALIGRPAVDDRSGPASCACEVKSVTISEK